MSQLIALATHVENERDHYKKRSHELESELQEKENKIIQLEKELQLEKLKNFVLFSVSKENGIDSTHIYEYKDDGIHFQDSESGTVGIYVQSFLGTDKTSHSLPKKKVKNKAVARAVKNVVEEEPVKQEENVAKIEAEMKDYATQNGIDISLKETQNKITTLLKELPTAKVIGKHASAIKELRYQLLGVVDLNKYIEIIKTHIKEFSSFLTSKKHENKKINTTISKYLYPIEQHLVKYGEYYDTSITPDEVSKLEVCLTYHSLQPKRYIPFNLDESINKILNYGLALFPIKQILTRMLVNKFGFPNVVYRGEKRTDMFSFYILQSADSKRVWKMDCRLLNLSDSVSKFLVNHCISMFRGIYFDTFNHNKYSQDYRNLSVICREDCDQLLQNIINLSKPKETCDIIRNIVSEHSTIKPTEQDKFDFQADDKLVNKNYQSMQDSNDLIAINIKRLFDDIVDEDVEKLINSF